jgi:hypothetical protein
LLQRKIYSLALAFSVEQRVKRQSMITQQVTAIALRVFALWLLVQVILHVPSFIMLFASAKQYPEQEIPSEAYIGIIGSFIIIGLIAAFLINRAANSILRGVKTGTEVILSGESQKVLFQLSGLYFVVNSLAYLPRSLSFISSTLEMPLSSIVWPAGLVFQLIIGLWLLSCTTFWLNLFSRLRGRA